MQLGKEIAGTSGKIPPFPGGEKCKKSCRVSGCHVFFCFGAEKAVLCSCNVFTSLNQTNSWAHKNDTGTSTLQPKGLLDFQATQHSGPHGPFFPSLVGRLPTSMGRFLRIPLHVWAFPLEHQLETVLDNPYPL